MALARWPVTGWGRLAITSAVGPLEGSGADHSRALLQ
jgi:hypothetical protein